MEAARVGGEEQWREILVEQASDLMCVGVTIMEGFATVVRHHCESKEACCLTERMQEAAQRKGKGERNQSVT